MKPIRALITDLAQGTPMASLRTMIQGAFGLFCLWAGWRFYHFYLWAIGRSEVFVSRPPSVEGFLPISALMGAKQLILSGRWDMIHPAGLTIFLAALVIALLLRKGFCGWICPVGFASNLAEKIGRRLGLLIKTPIWLDIPLSSLKYLLLGFFAFLILWQMPLAQIQAFNNSPYNLAVDAKMLLFFLSPSFLAGSIMGFLVMISLVIRNFWCRFLCPYGALLGIAAFFSPLAIRRDQRLCIDCGRCEKICPAGLRIMTKKTVTSAECIGCTECAGACPVPDCLTLAGPGRRPLPLVLLPAGVLAVFFGFWLWALATGHWQTEVSPGVMKKFYSMLADLPHPGL